MSKTTIQQPASVNEAESKAGFAAPPGSALCDQIQKYIRQLSPHIKEREAAHLLADALVELYSLQQELRAYREGGVTEEILRRNDGYIKVGRGCVIALASEMPNVQAQQRATNDVPNTEDATGALAAAPCSATVIEDGFCTTVDEAIKHGWINPYEGGRATDGWKGRIYGRKPGNHRVWRCTKTPNDKLTQDARP